MSQNKAFSTPFILAVLCIYFSYFLHGISVITLAQNMSSLAEKFSTDNAGIAYLISGIGLGRLISILFFGVISDKFGRRAVILMAVIMYLLFFFGIPACPNLTLAYGLAVCVGIANSALDTGGYPALMECFPKASGSAVILVKAMVSFGQMFYPMLVSYMLLNNIWYGYGLIIPGILFVLITLMLLKSKFPSQLVDASGRYLDHLKMEYAFWMDGAESLIPNQAYRHVVRMPDGSLLNRYWDDRDTPRDESWLEDVETAKHSGRPPNEVYRDLRAGAASGWDYSSRWLRDTGRLASIRTTQFIPIDLNAFLFKLESAIANISALKGEKETEALFRQKASARRDAVNRYLWDDENGIYRDYDWRREQLALFSAAAIVPLYVGMANHEQADRLANAVRSRLLTPGGILASEYETGEQWDKPNGWAPLQWMAIQGFKMYGDDLLGDEIARSWLKTVNQFYLEQHKMIEKYHIADGVPREGGGGEYPLQDGFGWTNGVVRRLIGLYGEP